MKDAEYLFYTDCAEKKRIARSTASRNRTGKGAVRMPSDYLSRKEVESMSGEVKTYDLSKPMTWRQFKKLSDDLQRMYLESLDEKFKPTTGMLSEMFGIASCSIRQARDRLGMKPLRGKGNVPAKSMPDRAGFDAWLHAEENVACEATVEKPEFSVSCADFDVVATPDELATLLKIVAGSDRRRFKISFGEGG